jgi:hypothetical protein
MPTLLRKWFELFFDRTFDTISALETGVSPSTTGSAHKDSILA